MGTQYQMEEAKRARCYVAVCHEHHEHHEHHEYHEYLNSLLLALSLSVLCSCLHKHYEQTHKNRGLIMINFKIIIYNILFYFYAVLINDYDSNSNIICTEDYSCFRKGVFYLCKKEEEIFILPYVNYFFYSDQVSTEICFYKNYPSNLICLNKNGLNFRKSNIKNLTKISKKNLSYFFDKNNYSYFYCVKSEEVAECFYFDDEKISSFRNVRNIKINNNNYCVNYFNNELECFSIFYENYKMNHKLILKVNNIKKFTIDDDIICLNNNCHYLHDLNRKILANFKDNCSIIGGLIKCKFKFYFDEELYGDKESYYRRNIDKEIIDFTKDNNINNIKKSRVNHLIEGKLNSYMKICYVNNNKIMEKFIDLLY
jgi:hypothetical protein